MAGALAEVFPDGTEEIGAVGFKPLLAPKKQDAEDHGSKWRKRKNKRATRRTNKT